MKRAIYLLSGLLAAIPTVPAFAQIQRFDQVVPGRVFRGSMPENQADFDYLHKLGVKTIISFRNFTFHVEPERKLAEKNGVIFLNIPLPGMPMPDQPDETSVFSAIHDMTEPGLQPVYIHCALGRDRTGMVAALYRIYIQGWSPQAAYREWTDHGFPNNWELSGLSHFFWHHTDPTAYRRFESSLNPGVQEFEQQQQRQQQQQQQQQPAP